ncbi:class A beta-lactamase [Frigoribacterium sp. CFBP9039]|uniref:class A beta-lactamase n=1 Tax=Frigoribacterium sp. CFBP9029 TaxID=3096541 RepID=UPI002A6A7AA8|nr:class A beta-lactamase [Frigoribacterium sp. CFBP9039]MDY0945734.1 class A beta-lactamase [Frigoribacterium sp. CFBP9039]
MRRRTATPTTAVLASAAIVVAGVTGCTTGATQGDAGEATRASSAPASATPAPTATTAATAPTADASAALGALETEFDARVGVSALDTGSGTTLDYRADERFGYASTIKVLAAAAFLQQVPADQRDEVVTWTAADVSAAGYSPVTSQYVDEGMSLSSLAEAAVRQSDNTALNLVLDRIGGPAGLDEALEQLGDSTTEVVNREPDLNTIEPGSTDDTTTPSAFTADLAALASEENLAPVDRALLLDWASGNATGDALVRAGAPEGWTVVDKSGGAGGIRNDVAVVTPPGRDPIVLTVLTARNDPEVAYDDALVARVAAAVLAEFG